MILVPVLGTGIVGQLLKVLFHSLRARRWRLARLGDFESFPSLHPLLAGCLCWQVGDGAGWSSTAAAVTMGFTGIVLYDTMGVKRAAGRQARILKRLGREVSLERHLTELLGQSPARALLAACGGALLGIVIERAWLALLLLSC
ncbi:MAG: divergent PAP2 family protein [Candidatus Krumholzibacteriota bacterium]|nr:divergent PAP2 family protein [Candidatus Krumholzibacteriota bacterium]